MSIFDKCKMFHQRMELLKSQNQFFYLREIDPTASPVVTMQGREVIMLGSNNYLGLATHPKVIESAVNATRQYGTGSCSSRVLTGTSSLHNKLEERLARFKGTEDGVVFSTGYMNMMGTIAALTGEGDVILSDALNHASIVEGCRLSKAEVKIYRHNDMASLEEELAKCNDASSKLIVTDGVFSMKGTVANLPEIKRLADSHHAAVMVDDAHGTGVLGEKGHGTLEHYNMEGDIDLTCMTFSKSMATVGGFTGARHEVIDYLKLNARPFIFTASPPPSVMATVLTCLEVIEEEPHLLRRLYENTRRMKSELQRMGYTLEKTITPIVPIIIGDDEKTFRMAGELEEEGVLVNPVVSPAVPEDASLIRVSVMATLAPEQIGMAVDKFKKVGKRLGIL